jgi:hypothetical protein
MMIILIYDFLPKLSFTLGVPKLLDLPVPPHPFGRDGEDDFEELLLFGV